MRDILGDIGDTAVLGISPDKPAKQAKFDEKYGLGFPLLADEDHAVAEAFGAWGEKSMYGKKYMGIIRSAFLIDEAGKIQEAWPKVSPKDTPGQPAQVAWLTCPAPIDVLPHRPPFLFVDELARRRAGPVGHRALAPHGRRGVLRRPLPGPPHAARAC